jgi:hypothetical protein
MINQHRALTAVVLLMAVCLAACGSTPPPTPAPRTPTPSPRPTPVPPPDTLGVQIAATGVGAWQLVAVPVAVLHNQAARHGATQVVVHFTAMSGTGRQLHSLDSVAVNLPPNATMIVTADCTDSCNNAASTTTSLSIGGWVETAGIAFSGSGVSYQCSAGCGGRESGEVVATLAAATPVGTNAVVTVFADCVDAGGTIIGGGSTQLSWPGGAHASVDISVIVNRTPTTCGVSASTGW